jgi:hypothetical protein
MGGFVRQYQVSLDPTKLLAWRLPHLRAYAKVRACNLEIVAGGKLTHFLASPILGFRTPRVALSRLR